METLVLKLVVTPILIGGASLAARRWGPAVGGWIVSFPLTSGPVILFIALDHGRAFAAETALASLAGNIPIAAFCLAYAVVARRGSWPQALIAASLAWAVLAIAIEPALQLSALAMFVLVLAVWGATLRLMPRGAVRPGTTESSAWDVPLRVIVGTSVVLLVTGIAPYVGPQVSGLIAMLPVIGAVLAVFAHQREGAYHAIGVVRGILTGLFGTAAFHATVSGTIVALGPAAAFGLAIVVIGVSHSLTLRVVRRSSEPLAMTGQGAGAPPRVVHPR